ncbi:MAG: hypothetical protein ACTHLE_20815 [Agriterribacter sp.]
MEGIRGKVEGVGGREKVEGVGYKALYLTPYALYLPTNDTFLTLHWFYTLILIYFAPE